nr:MAG TPA: hypothetical protein [Caudoviricetes sp.]
MIHHCVFICQSLLFCTLLCILYVFLIHLCVFCILILSTSLCTIISTRKQQQ